MGEVIAFYHPVKVPRAVLTLAEKPHSEHGPHTCVIEHTGKHPAHHYHLCECGLEWGSGEQGAEVKDDSAKELLTKCLEKVETIDQVVVLTMDKDGVLGFLGNCEGFAETLLFLELVKAQMLFSRVENKPNGDTFV